MNQGRLALEDYIIWFDHLGMSDVDRVGGKNASLGEMISNLANAGVTVPGGFATTAHAYREFLAKDGLREKIDNALDSLDVNDVNELARVGSQIRQWIIDMPFPEALEQPLKGAYEKLQAGNANMAVAVRSSATAEDLPDASFAGQQETFLNVVGLEQVRTSVKEVFASLFNDRAISYRVHHGFDHKQVALSAGI
jgi:pyruvate,water dikinase